MQARMEVTNAEVTTQITADMVELMRENPKATLADWAVRSEWAQDTGGVRDEAGSPLREQGGAWQRCWAGAVQQVAAGGTHVHEEYGGVSLEDALGGGDDGFADTFAAVGGGGCS